MLCQYSLKLDDLAARIEASVEQVLTQGYRTRDIQSSGTTLVGTAEMGQQVLAALQ
jgi:3-isopropylmalate dehydrogenase